MSAAVSQFPEAARRIADRTVALLTRGPSPEMAIRRANGLRLGGGFVWREMISEFVFLVFSVLSSLVGKGRDSAVELNIGAALDDGDTLKGSAGGLANRKASQKVILHRLDQHEFPRAAGDAADKGLFERIGWMIVVQHLLMSLFESDSDHVGNRLHSLYRFGVEPELEGVEPDLFLAFGCLGSADTFAGLGLGWHGTPPGEHVFG